MKSIIFLQGLDCPHCAEKIALKCNKINGVSKADMDFINKKMYISHSCEKTELLKDVTKIVKSLEPDVGVEFFENRNEDDKTSNEKFEIIKIIIGIILFGISFFIGEKPAFLVLIVAYVISGYEVVFEAVRNILKGRPFDENFLMTVASIGAMIIGEPSEGVAVMLFYQIGELFQKRAVNSSRRSIKKLMELKPEYVSVVEGDNVKTVSPEEVKTGDIIRVKAGERVAVDGILLSDSASLDMSSLTGESLPVTMLKDNEILSGCINSGKVIDIRATRNYENSAVSKLLEMVQNSTSQKSKTEKFITRFARVYTPFVVLSALLLAVLPPVFSGFDTFSDWIYRALVFLVISCPCALVISVPLSFFAGIGCASRNGILIKGAKFIEQLSNCKVVAFDKTGTITKGEFRIQKIDAYKVSENELLKIASTIEKGSAHPIAKSILNAYNGECYEVSDIKEIAGYGIKGVINGEEAYCVSSGYIKKLGIEISDDEAFTSVCILKNNELLGIIYLGDSVKETSKSAINNLYNVGVSKTVMLTGDKTLIAEKISNEVGISDFKAELLPENKVSEIEKLIGEKVGIVAYVGDGINDAPVIARSDIGFSMGNIGSDVAVEASDVVIMNDDIDKISQAIRISKKTMSIAKQNIIFALSVKAVILVLGALGISNMWFAVFADVGVSFIAVLNSLRAMKIKL